MNYRKSFYDHCCDGCGIPNGELVDPWCDDERAVVIWSERWGQHLCQTCYGDVMAKAGIGAVVDVDKLLGKE